MLDTKVEHLESELTLIKEEVKETLMGLRDLAFIMNGRFPAESAQDSMPTPRAESSSELSESFPRPALSREEMAEFRQDVEAARRTGTAGPVATPEVMRDVVELRREVESALRDGTAGPARATEVEQHSGVAENAAWAVEGFAPDTGPSHRETVAASDEQVAPMPASGVSEARPQGDARIDSNLVASLIRWAGRAKTQLGTKNVAGLLEIYKLSGHLSRAIETIIVRIVKLDILPERAAGRAAGVEDLVEMYLHLHGIVYGAGHAPAIGMAGAEDMDLGQSEGLSELRSSGEPAGEPAAADDEVARDAPVPLEAMLADLLASTTLGKRASVPGSTVEAAGVQRDPVAETAPERQPTGLATSARSRSLESNGHRTPESLGPIREEPGALVRTPHASDLTEAEWALVEPLVPPSKTGGRPCKYDRRAILDGILYVMRTGCSWRALPDDLPPWKIVHHYYRTWRDDGSLGEIVGALRPYPRQGADSVRALLESVTAR